MASDTVVLAIFDNEASADIAAAELKESGTADGDAIAVLALNDKGELKANKMGKRSAGKGAAIGTVVALVTPVGLVAGIVGGGLLGSLHHKNLGLDKADKARLGSELEGGKAAVGVLVHLDEATSMADRLSSMGGTAETHRVSAEASTKRRRPPRRTGRSSPGAFFLRVLCRRERCRDESANQRACSPGELG
jgi:hypothetical protein